MKQLGFIGAGNMATAIITGIVQAKLDISLSAYDRDEEKRNGLASMGVHPAESAEEIASGSDYILLAVKPQNFPEVLTQLSSVLPQDKVVISIAAGITPAVISSGLGFDAKVVQVMPNTPMLLGYGASALSRSPRVSDEEFEFVRGIFECSGVTAVLPNEKMNESIAIHGSTPAFIYRFAECIVNYGKSQGLEEEVCLKLFAQTLIGSAKMMTESGRSIEELIQMVSSKGGTTVAGLAAMTENGFEKSVAAGCESCVRRAYELAK